jgi:hypothetical protein
VPGPRRAAFLFLCRTLLPRRGRGCRLGRLGLELSDRDDLDARIGWRGRTTGILQLFLAEAKRLQPLRRHLEGVDQHIPERIGAPLAQDQIVVAAPGGFDVIDDQIAIGPQFRIGQRVGDAADGLVRGRPDQGRIRVEHDVEADLRQF